MEGRISSFETLGALDGPGVRFIVFMQGCPLRCVYCHNPETWRTDGGTLYSEQDVIRKIRRYIPYFGKKGGVTVSGGEPLLQAEFLCGLFELCKKENIRTALDTAGSVFNTDVEKLLSLTDLILLDIKFTNEGDYLKNTGCRLSKTLNFLKAADRAKKEVWIRHVVVPGLTDSDENLRGLLQIVRPFPCVRKIELLPFRKLCVSKYRSLSLPFPLENTPEAPEETMRRLNALLCSEPLH